MGLIQTRSGGDIGFVRHPLTYLVEAADDICYTIIDFEDGINLGLISEEYALEYLIKLVKDRINTQKYRSLVLKEDRLGYLRALAINTLISDAIDIFVQHEEAILKGDFGVSLLDKSKYKAQIDDIIALSVQNIYRSQEVIEKEIAGYRIISDILDVYTTALVRKREGISSNYDKLLINTLPERYRNTEGTLYETLLNTCCYVASLSDSRAILLHKKINGSGI